MSTLKPFSATFLKSFFLSPAALLAVFLSSGCAPTSRVVGGGSSAMDGALLEPYDGPKARIAVAAFEDKTAKGYGRIGEGLSAMFTTALVNSQRFIVLERDLIEEVIREQDLASGRRVKAGTGAETGEIEGAQLILTGAVTEFEPEKLGLGGGIVGLSTFIGTVLLREKNDNIPVGAATYVQSHIVIDVRLVDAATSQIVASVTVEGQGHDWGGGVIAEVGGGHTELPLAFGGFQHSATEKAVRKAIDLAVFSISHKTPPRYFLHRETDFNAGRMVGHSFLELPHLTGENFPQRGFRTVENRQDWMGLAHNIGHAPGEADPVDFSSRRIVVLFAGTQSTPGRKITVEKVVAFPEQVVISASLTDPPSPPVKARVEEESRDPSTSFYPVALLQIESSTLPVTVHWQKADG